MYPNHLPRLLDKSGIGRVIREIREGAGLTQQELAEYLGSPRGQGDVSRWEIGETQPRAEVLLQIAALAGKGMEVFQASREGGREGGARPRVERDQALVDALLEAVGTKTSLRDAEELTGIKYSTINKWRRQRLKSALSAATRSAAEDYLSQHHPQQVPVSRNNGDGAHAPREQGGRVDVLALLQGDETRADDLTASHRDLAVAHRELATAFRVRAEAIARLVMPAPPQATTGRALTPGDFAGGVEAPEVEVRDPARQEDPPTR